MSGLTFKYVQTPATYFLRLASLTIFCPLKFMPRLFYAVGLGNSPSPEITLQKEGHHRLK